MKTAEVLAVLIAGVILAVGWTRGWLGHRSCRKLHMALSGRTSDVAFQPVNWHPRDTKGHPRSPKDDKGEGGGLQQPTCKKMLFWTKVIVVLLAVLIIAAEIKNRQIATMGLLGAEAGVIVVWARYLHHRLAWIRLTREVASPLASALSYHLRLSAADIVDGMTVTRDKVVSAIEVPSTFLSHKDNIKEVDEVLRERLKDQDPEWHLESDRPFIALPFRQKLPPVGTVRFRDLLAIGAIGECLRGDYVMGMGTEDPFTASFRKHAHHIWCFATGRGKSTLLRAVLAQLLGQDERARAVCLDTKRVSLKGIEAMPGLTYINNPDDMPAMIAGLRGVATETRTRFAEYERTGFKRYPLLLLVLEEAADLDRSVERWGRRTGSRVRVAEFWEDLATILNQGREVNVRVLCISQDVDDRKYGGIGLRGNFELKAMSGWDDNQWNKIVTTKPVPRPDDGAGRIVVTWGRHQVPVQAMTAQPSELLAYVRDTRAGRPASSRTWPGPDDDGAATLVLDRPATDTDDDLDGDGSYTAGGEGEL